MSQNENTFETTRKKGLASQSRVFEFSWLACILSKNDRMDIVVIVVVVVWYAGITTWTPASSLSMKHWRWSWNASAVNVLHSFRFLVIANDDLEEDDKARDSTCDYNQKTKNREESRPLDDTCNSEDYGSRKRKRQPELVRFTRLDKERESSLASTQLLKEPLRDEKKTSKDETQDKSTLAKKPKTEAAPRTELKPVMSHDRKVAATLDFSSHPCSASIENPIPFVKVCIFVVSPLSPW